MHHQSHCRFRSLAILAACGLLIGCATTQPESPPPAEPAEITPPASATERDSEPTAPRESELDSQNQSVPESERTRPAEVDARADRPKEPTEPIAGKSEREAEPEPEADIDSKPTPSVQPSEPAERPLESDSAPPAVAADETGEVTTSDRQSDQPLRNLEGRVEVLRNGREQRFASTYLNQTIVSWRPADQSEFSPMEEQRMVTRRKRFYPQTMAVTSGTVVRFPNLDEIRHNVFSLTPGHKFDVGMYGPDEGATRRFDGTGMVEIFCNLHPNMAAFLLVLDTPHFVTPDEDGHFVLKGLPPGPGELLVWNYRADNRVTSREMSDSSLFGELVEVTIDITRPTVPQHTTKEGSPYHSSRRN